MDQTINWIIDDFSFTHGTAKVIYRPGKPLKLAIYRYLSYIINAFLSIVLSLQFKINSKPKN